MKTIRWILVVGLAGTSIGAAVLGSCAIDDDITWITDPNCTSNCTPQDLGGFSCDVDSTCTEAPGCTDWDCADRAYSPPDGGADVPEARGEDADLGVDGSPPDDDGATSGDGGETDGPPPFHCYPSCGGTREEPRTIALGEPLGDCTACPAPSQWFQFTIESGVRFEVVMQTALGTSVEFLLYAEDGSLVASAGMEADASFAANAATAATYLMRVRAADDSTGPVGYGLTVQRVTEP